MSVPRSYALPPQKSKYTTVVPIDGGGIRGILSVVVLVELEDSIKRHILTEKPELLPEGVDIKTIDDFEISLADFIDCFAGTSIGAVSALYLASKGGNGRASHPAGSTCERAVRRYRHSLPGPPRARAAQTKYCRNGYPGVSGIGPQPYNPPVVAPFFVPTISTSTPEFGSFSGST